MLEAFTQLTSIDYIAILSGIVVFIAAATTLKAGMDKFFTTFEITPPWEKSKKEEKEYRKDVRNQLTDLKQQESDFEKTQLNYRSKNEKNDKRNFRIN